MLPHVVLAAPKRYDLLEDCQWQPETMFSVAVVPVVRGDPVRGRVGRAVAVEVVEVADARVTAPVGTADFSTVFVLLVDGVARLHGAHHVVVAVAAGQVQVVREAGAREARGDRLATDGVKPAVVPR